MIERRGDAPQRVKEILITNKEKIVTYQYILRECGEITEDNLWKIVNRLRASAAPESVMRITGYGYAYLNEVYDPLFDSLSLFRSGALRMLHAFFSKNQFDGEAYSLDLPQLLTALPNAVTTDPFTIIDLLKRIQLYSIEIEKLSALLSQFRKQLQHANCGVCSSISKRDGTVQFYPDAEGRAARIYQLLTDAVQ